MGQQQIKATDLCQTLRLTPQQVNFTDNTHNEPLIKLDTHRFIRMIVAAKNAPFMGLFFNICRTTKFFCFFCVKTT